MKKIVYTLVCVLGIVSLSSCRSTAPCGLSENTKQIQYDTTEILVSEVE